MKKLLFTAAGLLVLSGCASTAGPFVTNISNNGDGDLVVEKCMVKFDPWMSVVNNSDCTSTAIKVK